MNTIITTTITTTLTLTDDRRWLALVYIENKSLFIDYAMECRDDLVIQNRWMALWILLTILRFKFIDGAIECRHLVVIRIYRWHHRVYSPCDSLNS